MKMVRVGVVRYAKVARAIAEALGINPPPDCRIGRGRITVAFRQMGASRWPEDEKLEYALHVAEVARSVLAADSRRLVRRRGNRAVVVLFDDAFLDGGCDVASRWQCIVPRAR